MKDEEIIEVLLKKPRNSDLFEIFKDLPLDEIYKLLSNSDIPIIMLTDEDMSFSWDRLFGKRSKDQVLKLIDKACKNGVINTQTPSDENHYNDFDIENNYGMCAECESIFIKTSVNDNFCQNCR
jgi:hypothetical protein